MKQIPEYGVAASSGGPTTPSTTTAEMPGYVTPPPGLTLPDFSNWSLPPPEIPPSRGLPAATEGLPGIGRSDMIRNAVGRHARVPALLAVKFRSGGWKKDLEHVLKVYYKHNIQAPYREAEWVRVRDKLFEHFLPHKEEALAIKERSPLGFIPLIEEQFWRATGLRLHGLQGFILWIKQGSYYHRLVAQQGHLQRCPHLVRAPLPRWPQTKPSESHWDSHKRAETLAAGSSEPSTGATTAPVQETPAEEPPVTEAPASDTPRSDTPAPMETGRAGYGQSWAEQVEAGLEAEFRQDRPAKHYQSI